MLKGKGGDNLVVKIIELVGTSPESWPKAVEEAVSKAGEGLRNIHGVDVIGLKAKVENGSQYLASEHTLLLAGWK